MHKQTTITEFLAILSPPATIGDDPKPTAKSDGSGVIRLPPVVLGEPLVTNTVKVNQNSGSGGSIRDSVEIVLDSNQKNGVSVEKPIPRNNHNNINSLVSGHHIRYSCKYLGSQPNINPNSIVYLKGWKKRIWKGKNYKIIANKRKLECILEFDGDGSTVRTKLDYCQNRAEDLLRRFASEQGVSICSNIELQPFSHWVVKSKKLSKELKPLGETKGNERVRPVYDDSSHHLKLELTGRESEKGAVGLDYLFIELPNSINSYLQGQTEDRQLMKTNLAVMVEILKELRKNEVLP